MSAELLSSRPTYLQTWPAFAFRQWVMCCQCLCQFQYCAWAQGARAGLEALPRRACAGTHWARWWKHPLGFAGLLVSENQAWNETSQWTEYCHSLIMHGQTSPEEKEAASHRETVCSSVLQYVSPLGVNGLRITQTLPLCVCGVLCLVVVFVDTYGGQISFRQVSLLNGWKQTLFSLGGWCLLSVMPVQLLNLVQM